MALALNGTTGIVQANLATGVAGTGPTFSAYANANQSISTSTFTKVQLPLEVFDTAGAFDAATNYRFTPLVAGYYQINGQIRCIATNMTALIASIYKNGAEYTRGVEQTIAATNAVQQISVSDVVFLNGSTDYVELYGLIIGTSPSFQVVSAAVTSKLSGALVRAA